MRLIHSDSKFDFEVLIGAVFGDCHFVPLRLFGAVRGGVEDNPPELLVFQGQDASALGEKLYFNSWQRMRGGEVALGAPAVERMSDSVCTLAMGCSWLI